MYTYVTTYHQFGEFISDLQKADLILLDTETTGLDPFRDKVLLIQAKLLETTYIFDARKLGEKYSKYIVQLIKDSHKIVVGHNIKFDIKMIYTNFGELLLDVYDTMLAEILINNGLDIGDERYYSLNDLTTKYLNVTLNKEIRKNFIGGENEITEQELIYSATDVEYLETIRVQQMCKLTEQKQTRVVELEMKLLPVICSMELEGVQIDKELWNKLGGLAYIEAEKLRQGLVEEILQKTLAEHKFANALELADFFRITDGAKTKKDRAALEGITDISCVAERIKGLININSTNQLKSILNNVYGIPVENTNEKTINKFEIGNPIITTLLKYREHEKSVNTYGDKFIGTIHPETGRIHTEFNQLGMKSGRVSSSKPNLQNIKRESEYRNAFIARPGKKIIAIDFSQEELRLMAVIANVKGMIDAYVHGIDLHLKTGAALFKVELDAVTKEQRRVGKTMNFAVGYGSTEYGLFKNFGIPMDDGREYLKLFYEEVYPEIDQCKRAVGKKILSLGWSTTLLGRKRFFQIPAFYPGGAREKEKYEASIIREGFNHIIQGTGAEILKKSLIRIFYENPFGEQLKILIQVYDEIVCEADDEIAEEACAFISNIMYECEREYLRDVVPAEVSVARNENGELNRFWSH